LGDLVNDEAAVELATDFADAILDIASLLKLRIANLGNKQQRMGR